LIFPNISDILDGLDSIPKRKSNFSAASGVNFPCSASFSAKSACNLQMSHV